MLLCADIGGSFIDFALVHPDGRLEQRHAVPTPIDDAKRFITALETLCAPYPSLPLHIAIAGVENPQTGHVHAANIPGILTVPLREKLSLRTQRVVRIGNDADCFALAEARFGAARGHRNVFGLILGTGIGGGLVLDGQIVPGLGGVTGELGHAPVVIAPPFLTDPDEVAATVPLFRCGCGQSGCLDTIAGARSLERLHLWAGGTPETSHAILRLWEEGDRQATRTLSVWMTYTSAALAHVLNVTGSTVVPVAGGLSNSDLLVQTLDRAVRDRILSPTSQPLLRRAILGKDAGILGAACLGPELCYDPC